MLFQWVPLGEKVGLISDPVDSEFHNAEHFIHRFVLVLGPGPVEKLVFPIRVRGLQGDLLQGEAHREPTIEMLKVFQAHVNVLDGELHVVNDLCDKVLQESLFLLLGFLSSLNAVNYPHLYD